MVKCTDIIIVTSKSEVPSNSLLQCYSFGRTDDI